MEKYLELAPVASLGFDAKTFSAAANAGKMLADAGGAHARLLQSVEEIAAAVTGRSLDNRARSSALASLLDRFRGGGRDRGSGGAGRGDGGGGGAATSKAAPRSKTAAPSKPEPKATASAKKAGPMTRRKRAAG
jgi:hypothetical protein